MGGDVLTATRRSVSFQPVANPGKRAQESGRATFQTGRGRRIPAENPDKVDEVVASPVPADICLRGAKAPAENQVAVETRIADLDVGRQRVLSAASEFLVIAAVVCRQVQADIDPTSWLPGDRPVTAMLPVPVDVEPGQYTLGLALVNETSEQPAICLAIDAPQSERLYRLSSIRVK